MANEHPLPCWIYRSDKKDEMYLYVDKQDDFGHIPQALMDLFGTPTLVMRLELSPQRPLAREDVQQVMNNLRAQGFHLQMPPQIHPPHLNA